MAESIASGLMDKASQSDRGSMQTGAMSAKKMKTQIFNVCKMIFEEQREAGSQLKQIERRIEALKVQFKQAMLKKKGYYTSQ